MQFVKTDWMARAACKGVDPKMFHAQKATQHYWQAKAVCDSCPVERECLFYALDEGINTGLWGGKSPRERQRIRRGMRRGDA